MKLDAKVLSGGRLSVTITEHPMGFVIAASLAEAEIAGIALLDAVARARREESERRSAIVQRPRCRECEHDCSECICASAAVPR